MKVNRRKVLGAGLLLGAGYMTSHATLAHSAKSLESSGDSAEPQKSDKTESYGAGNTGLGITRQISSFIAGIEYQQLPPETVHEAKRAALDWLGCAIAGSQHSTPKILIRSFKEMGSLPSITVLGHKALKLSMLDAPVANGQMGHVLDFDDTHLGGVILHTSTATMPALLAIGEHAKSSGKEIITALVAAFEAGIRVGQGMPGHHRGGWHLTGTLGTVAATGGASRLRKLNAVQTLNALGIGCTQAAGMQQNRGSDCKSLHAGKSAYHGVLASMLAKNGFASSPENLEGNLGFTRIYSKTQDLPLITANFGSPWMINGNGYKPYACGVVLHPLIDASIKVSQEYKVPEEQIEVLEIFVHPDVIRITGVDAPGSGLMSKFSANHAVAVSYIDRAGGVAQFSNEKAQQPRVQALRKIVKVTPVSSYRLDQATAVIRTKDGKSYEAKIEHATGTVANPMSDQSLEAKFLGNTTAVMGKDNANNAIKMLWNLENVDNINSVIRLFA
jgi:2-methylcitrate dehydratase PrpD